MFLLDSEMEKKMDASVLVELTGKTEGEEITYTALCYSAQYTVSLTMLFSHKQQSG